jgi:hypothetical protein
MARFASLDGTDWGPSKLPFDSPPILGIYLLGRLPDVFLRFLTFLSLKLTEISHHFFSRGHPFFFVVELGRQIRPHNCIYVQALCPPTNMPSGQFVFAASGPKVNAAIWLGTARALAQSERLSRFFQIRSRHGLPKAPHQRKGACCKHKRDPTI